MGKSVFLLPSKSQSFNRKQIGRLRKELNDSGLQLDGPFSDKGGAVAEIAGHVRSIAMQTLHFNEKKAAFNALWPLNLKSHPPGKSSTLDLPFILGNGTDWSEQREGAGAIACSRAVEHDGRKVRAASVEELTVLGVAVLRKLGIESYYSILCFDTGKLDKILQRRGAFPSQYPVVAIPVRNRIQAVSVVSSDLKAISRLVAPTSIEVLDKNSVTSLLKMINAVDNARALMRDIKARRAEFDGEGSLRAMQIGHMLFEAASLWTMEEAIRDVEAARGVLGKNGNGLASFRVRADKEYVHGITCDACHFRAAALAFLCDQLQEEVRRVVGEFEVARMITMMESLKDHKCSGKEGFNCVEDLLVYLKFPRQMAFHFHEPEECTYVKESQN